MATVFAWEGKTRSGAVQKGELSASNKDEVFALLRKQNILPINVTAKPKEIKLSFGAPKVEDKDIVIFTRQLATMIDAGLPLVQCLDILGSQTENVTLAKTVTQVRSDVESGSTFADALKKHPKVFDNLYCNMVAAGEAGGILDTILQRLAAYMEKFAKIKKQIKSAMVYPAVILFVAVSVVALSDGGGCSHAGRNVLINGPGASLPHPDRYRRSVIFFKGWGGLILAGAIVGDCHQLQTVEKNRKRIADNRCMSS